MRPRGAIRQLRLCTAFFVRLRSLLEGLSNDGFRFLVIHAGPVCASTAPEPTQAAPNQPNQQAKQLPPPLDRESSELLHAAVNTAHDFLGRFDPDIPRPFACLKVPDVPSFLADHVDKHEQGQLAAEFVDWFLTGNRDGTLLRRKALAVFLAATTLVVAAYFAIGGMSLTGFYVISALGGIATGYWAVFVSTAAELFGTNLRATVTTTVQNFVRGSLVLVAMLFTVLRDPLGLVGAALAVGALSLGVAFLGLWSLPETFAIDLDYHDDLDA